MTEAGAVVKTVGGRRVEAGDSRATSSFARQGRRWLTRGALLDVAGALASMVVTFVAVNMGYGWGRVFAAEPLFQWGDAGLYLALTKTIMQTGWWTHTSRLGFPNGQLNLDFPLGGDSMSLAVLRALRTVSSDPGRVVNLFYLFTFLAAALSAYIVLRVLSCRRWLAIPLAMAFAVLPYHFWRSEEHLFLSSYFVVPLGVLVAVRSDRILPFLHGESGARGRRVQPTRVALLGLGCLLLASSGTYYAFFCVMLLVAVSAARALSERDWRLVSGAFIVTGGIAVLLVLLLSPSLVQQWRHGKNEAALQRDFTEQEIYGLRIVELVTPSSSHRISSLAKLGADSERGGRGELGSSHLGILGTCGLLVILVWTLKSVLDRRDPTPSTEQGVDPDSAAYKGPPRGLPKPDGRQMRDISAFGTMTVVALIFAAPAGLGAVLSLAGLTMIRGWNRLSIFIGFMALAAVGLAAEGLLRRVRSRKRRVSTIAAVVAAFALCAGAFVDQVPDLRAVIRATKGEASDARSFFAETERVLGRDAAVYEWPYLPYPRTPRRNGVQAYDMLLGYVYTDTLRWSAGAMMGRKEDAAAALGDAAPGRLLPAIAVAGYTGLFIDRAGFADKTEQEAFEGAVTKSVGPPILVDRGARRVLYDLRPLASRLLDRFGQPAVATAAAHVSHPVMAEWTGGFSYPEPSLDGVQRWMGANGILTISNPWSDDRDVVVDFTAESPTSAGARLSVAGATQRDVVLGSGGAPMHLEAHLAPGATVSFDFSTDAQRVVAAHDLRDLRVQLRRIVVGDAAVEPMVAECEQTSC